MIYEIYLVCIIRGRSNDLASTCSFTNHEDAINYFKNLVKEYAPDSSESDLEECLADGYYNTAYDDAIDIRTIKLHGEL